MRIVFDHSAEDLRRSAVFPRIMRWLSRYQLFEHLCVYRGPGIYLRGYGSHGGLVIDKPLEDLVPRDYDRMLMILSRQAAEAICDNRRLA